MLKIEKHARGINITEVKENEFKGQYIVSLYIEVMGILLVML